ncbi:MBL fold metallo-hydrolase [Psychromarinibacter sp. C21-152]|uniref:MBL fold metallo-hydrolase n=1 Tax=Psychromarinibacter sediminicola TaxID=3033385 RepID=A0AAE3NPC3_9RHOB|nr:MBL fold metallo-hydrolase [Psychromarinibacter sediminicola]MDF0600004.1 MBL fold metallo-hydrolase [Psychromarinibacter sediminicola]
MHRREVLAGLAAAGAGALLPRFAVAEIPAGAGTVRTVSDGNLVLPRSFVLGGLPEEELAPILKAHGVSGDQLTPPCNVTLYQDDTRTVLFDVGAGATFMPSAGELFESLDAAGVAPEDVTEVVFTHAHPDHLWGLLDDFGDPAFPNARLMMGRAEWDYWTDPETVNTIGAERQAFAVGAARRLEMVADQMEFFEDDDEVLPGIVAVGTFGHTPGHMSFDVGGGDGVFVIGDAVANAHVAFARPGWATANDQDPETAAATRTALMGRLAEEARTVIGFHLPHGGTGRVVAEGDGYRFEAADS